MPASFILRVIVAPITDRSNETHEGNLRVFNDDASHSLNQQYVSNHALKDVERNCLFGSYI